jgi:hypothetical protein
MPHNNQLNNSSRKKWQTTDVIALIIQIAFPVISIIIAIFLPSDQLPDNAKLAIIGLGILVPLIVNQISLTNGQNNTEFILSEIKNKLQQFDEKLSHINPLLENAFLSGNDRIIRFALRRMDEVKKVLKYAIDNQSSGMLKPRDYYDELEHLADLITKDKKIHGKDFTGEIWAMTSFAPDEWIKDDSYEGTWIESLKQMIDLGITTKRICIIPSTLIEKISKEIFNEEETKDIPQFSGFVKLLKDYYGKKAKKGIAKHYIIKNTVDTDLTSTGGFFGIKLTDGTLHILTGETVDKFGSLTAESIFNEKEIKIFRERCEKFMKDKYILENVLTQTIKKAGFKTYIDNLDIVLDLPKLR